MDKLLSVKQAADKLGITYRACKNLLERGELPYIRYGERTPFLIEEIEIEKLVERSKR